jgi:protein-disulfide isomerase
MMSGDVNQLSMPVTEDDHQQGPSDAPVTLVEYGDYECPSCGAAYPVVKQLQRRLGDDLRFVFRDFPLTQIHPHAEAAAEAANSAGDQGAFWDYHDLLFENQEALTRRDLIRYARELKLDLDQFTEELEDHTNLDRVRQDFESGIESGVNGTPTFFINGTRYDGPAEFEEMLAALNEARA